MAETTNTATDVVKSTPLYDDDTLTNIKSFEDALAALADAGIETTEVTDYGDGFLVMDKAEFVNAPFVILDYKFQPSTKFTEDDGTPTIFSIVRIVAKDGRKAILTDGSSGIRRQLRKLESKGVTGGVICPKGFVVSEYDYIDEKGRSTPASTYYFHGM